MQNLPPVRSVDSGSTKARKKKMKKEPTALGPGTAKSSRIRSYDYKSWDQFDVVRMLIYHKVSLNLLKKWKLIVVN